MRCQFDPLAQPVEHLTFNQGVRGSIPRWVTTKGIWDFPDAFNYFLNITETENIWLINDKAL